MRILIQSAETRLYLGKGGRWIIDPRDALAFLDEVRARDYCLYRRLRHATVVALPADRTQASPAIPGGESHSVENEPETEKMKSKANTNRNTIKTQPGSSELPQAASKVAAPMPSVSTPAKKVAPQGTLKAVPPLKNNRASLPSREVNRPSIATRPAVVRSPEPVVTTIAAKIDVGLGNTLFIRGQGDGLSWDKGTALQCVDASTWIWSTPRAQGKVVFKLLLNDQVWSQGADLVVEPGTKTEIVPVF